jgi:Holliday junction resolvase RusA-like endonuclease
MEVKFCVDGEPKGKQRPRASIVHGHARMYTPKDTVNYETLVRYTYQSEVGKKLEGAIEATIIGYFPIPKSTSKKKAEMMRNHEIPYTNKIDTDNLAKVILDSLNNIAYDDDKQIYKLSVEKWYSDFPRVVVELREKE